MIAIIECSEHSSKTFPYDFHWQKACLPIVDKPNIVRVLNQLFDNGFSEENIYIVLGHRKDQVKATLKKFPKLNYVERSNGLKCSYESIANVIDSDVLLYNAGSVITDNDIQKFFSSKEKNKVFTIEKTDSSTNHIGVNVVQGLVENFYGHPREHYVTNIVPGLYQLELETFKMALNSDLGFEKNNSGAMPPQTFFIENGLNGTLLEKKIYAIENDKEVFQLNFPWDLLNANEYYVSELCGNIDGDIIGENSSIDPSARINGNVQIGNNTVVGKNVAINGSVIIGDNVLIDNGAILEGNNYIGDGTYIKDYAKIGDHTVIGKDNKIGHNAEMKGVTMKGVSAIHYSEIFGIVGTYVDIAAACVAGILRFNDTEQPQKIEGKIYSGKNTNAVFLGDFTRTGIGNIFLPGCKVGANCAVSPGLIVNENIEHHKIAFQEQSIVKKYWGPEKYGW
ncbi:glucosamine-1-phosphate N-acetyltransferase [Enterococcus florum]|uniref:Glucosamine-1-phosphate N-acetyltransferase n=1 Tax=Enterococcus florum TaxID=2480627 RepID=A0A4P5PHM3_9ENTE|nr:NDP-sugar synthase [Enterococcus florum]GCF95921.1 glucosamine-1-phosphate N-acetyltransferase [Enterococcus florum]